jgi:hypothetical protein
MALLAVEGFDYWSTSVTNVIPLASPWTYAPDVRVVSSSPGRHDKWAASSGFEYMGKTLTGDESDSTLIVGFGLCSSEGRDLCSFGAGGVDGEVAGCIPSITIHATEDSRIAVYEGWGPFDYASVGITGGSPGTLLGQSVPLDLGNQSGSFNGLTYWRYLEVKVSPAGVVVMHEDLEVVSVAGGSGGVLDNVFLWGNVPLDDVYLLNDQAPGPTNFIGTGAAVYHGMPGPGGAHEDWLPGGGDNWDELNSVGAFGDFSFGTVTSDVMNAYDLYPAGPGVPATPPNAIRGVQVSARAGKSDVGTRSIALLSSVGGSTDQSGDIPILATTTSEKAAIFHTQPNGSPWTATTLEAAEFGIKVR